MVHHIVSLLLALSLCLLLPAAPAAAEPPTPSLFVKKVDNLPEDFIFGLDASSVLAEEASGVVYRDVEGNPADVFQVYGTDSCNDHYIEEKA